MPGTVAVHEDVSSIDCQTAGDERECTVYYHDSWAGEPSDEYPDVSDIQITVDGEDSVDMQIGTGSKGDSILFKDEGVNCRVNEVGGESHNQHYYRMKCGVRFDADHDPLAP